MMLTIESIKSHLEGRHFPSILSPEDYAEIVDASLRELNSYSAMTRYASFTTVDGVQDYYIFDPDNATTHGIAAGALKLRDVLWNPGGDWSSLNIFSPGWTMLAQMVIFTGNFFHQPSQMMVMRQKLDSWKTQFGSQGHELVGQCGDKGTYLKLFPVPQTDTKVVLEFTLGMTLADVSDATELALYQWVEYYTSDALANLYATTAGIKLLNFADSETAMKYWSGRAARYHQRALNFQAGIGGIAIRG
jgi:hypothetical protein